MITKEYVYRYAAYLNDVIKHFNQHKNLKNFSQIATKHKITKINIEQFYMTNLHLWGNHPITTEKAIEVLKVVKGKDIEIKNVNIPNNEFITWEHTNGCRTIAYTQFKDGLIPYFLNFNGFEDEKDLIWINDSPSPSLDNCKMIKSTKEDIEKFAIALINKCNTLEDCINKLHN